MMRQADGVEQGVLYLYRGYDAAVLCRREYVADDVIAQVVGQFLAGQRLHHPGPYRRQF